MDNIKAFPAQEARQRMQIMRETADGFRIAEKDLELRGPGEVLGTRQTGAMMFRVADLARAWSNRHLLPDDDVRRRDRCALVGGRRRAERRGRSTVSGERSRRGHLRQMQCQQLHAGT